jgi:hypothetical protein
MAQKSYGPVLSANFPPSVVSPRVASAPPRWASPTLVPDAQTQADEPTISFTFTGQLSAFYAVLFMLTVARLGF